MKKTLITLFVAGFGYFFYTFYVNSIKMVETEMSHQEQLINQIKGI